jgi:predicted lipoprotein with Yx(FWY)xxD motif
MRFRLLVLPFVAAGLILPSASAAAASSGATVSVRSTRYGRILVDGRGHALYAFTRDALVADARATGHARLHGRRSSCEGMRPRGRSARTSLIRAIRRSDGSRPVTYAGRPLYFYAGDKKPGQVLCQNVSEFGGLWLVIRASGQLVR